MKHSKLRKNKPPDLSLCGTPAGYEGHLRRREWPCGRCLIGSSTYTEDEIRVLIGHQYDRDRDQQLWNTYRLSLDRYTAIFDQQGQRCGCCGSETSGDGVWHVDHDHETRLIRGILCLKCNTGIGQLGDGLAGVLKAVNYLHAHHDRGGHALAEKPPAPRTAPPVSSLMERCFALFQQGISTGQIVILLRLDPSLVEDIRLLWNEQARAVLPPKARHLFQISQDPIGCACCCGFVVPCDMTDLDSVQSATAQVNAHVEEGNSPRANWLAMQAEEEERRRDEAAKQAQELQSAKDEEFRRAKEEALQRAAQREQRAQDQKWSKDRRAIQKTRRRWKTYGKTKPL